MHLLPLDGGGRVGVKGARKDARVEWRLDSSNRVDLHTIFIVFVLFAQRGRRAKRRFIAAL